MPVNHERIIQITAAKGPEECCLAVKYALNVFVKEAEALSFNTEVLDTFTSAANNLQSVYLKIEGAEQATKNFIDSWTGSIQWICQSPYRKNHKRKNWYIGLNVLDVDHQQISLLDKDIKFEAIRASGPGGQHVNKVSSAIRAIHKPSGLTVVVSDQRSQHMNKKVAKLRLYIKLQEGQHSRQKQQKAYAWTQHAALERGNPVRVYQGKKFRRKK